MQASSERYRMTKPEAYMSPDAPASPHFLASQRGRGPLLSAGRRGTRQERGFTALEVVVVAAISLILFAIAIPTLLSALDNFRLTADTRDISAQLALARMRAASNGSNVRLNINLTARTYQIELWNGNAYQLEGGVNNLSEGSTFGYGSITTPAGSQSTIAQTTPIYFNSRGIVTDSSGNPTSNSAIYITNPQGFYTAIALNIAGQPTAYRYTGSAWVAL